MSIDFPDTLLALETTAWQEIQAGSLTAEQAADVQAGVTAFATEAGRDRYEVEMALKRVVRYPEAEEG